MDTDQKVNNIDISTIPIELTPSKGNQAKYKINDMWYKEDYLGYEAASEFFCSQILKHSNIKDFVEYQIVNIHTHNTNRTACQSKNFLPENTEIITLEQICCAHIGKPLHKFLENKSLEQKIIDTVSLIEDYTGLSNVGEYLTKMLEFDALVLNEDRHANNIIFLLKDGEYSFGPIFDNGAAYLSDTSRDYPIEHKNPNLVSLIHSVKAKPFSSSFEKQVQTCQKLYGKQLQFSQDFHMDHVIPIIEQFYSKDIASRIQLTYKWQQKKYDYMFHKQQTIDKEDDYIFSFEKDQNERVD